MTTDTRNYLRILAAFAFGLALAWWDMRDCHAETYSATDFAGNVYPAECRRDLSSLDTPIDMATPADLEATAKLMGLRSDKRLLGAYSSVTKRITIDETLRGWKRDESIHHERCHALVDKLWPETFGQWHR